MNFFRVLINPAAEELEFPERRMVTDAANLLQIGEFQFLQLAFFERFGYDMPKVRQDAMFDSYMLENKVPDWALHYARIILLRDERGVLNDTEPRYHRYDPDHGRPLPGLVRRLVLTCVVLVFGLGGAVFVSLHQTAGPATSVLPPYFQQSELPPLR